MTKKKKALAILIGSALFTSAARFSFSYLRFNTAASRFHRVKLGASRSQVIDLLGEPNDRDGRCEREIRIPPHGCSTELIYAPPLAVLFHDRYVVSFSSDERVIEARRYSSP